MNTQQPSTNPQTGLTSADVLERRERYGANTLTPAKKKSLFILFFEKFADLTVLILCACAAVSIALEVSRGNFPWEGVAILLAVFVATCGTLWSELKADKAFELLKRDTDKILVKVIRDAQFQVVANSNVVVGDIVRLEAGDKIPADARYLSGVEFEVDESLMTGEQMAVPKNVEQNRLTGGTYVLSGQALACVTAVGDRSELGRIAASLQGETAQEGEALTPLQKRLKRLSQQISVWGMAAAVLIFAVLAGCAFCSMDRYTFANVAGALFRAFMVAVTIVVVAVPEGLPLAVFVTLGLGMRKIREDNNLVRKMVAAETIGSATVICTDKTGTLTMNQMGVDTLWFGGRCYAGATLGEAKSDADFDLFARGFSLNSTAEIDAEGRAVGNATEAAVLRWLASLNLRYAEFRAGTPVVRRIPFSADRKRMTTVAGGYVFTKGAPERVFPLCTGGDVAGAERIVRELAQRAVRTLAVAYKEERTEEAPEEGLTLLGIVGLTDPLRPDVAAAVAGCRKAGIRVIMITGDHPLTARAIACDAGLVRPESAAEVLTGETFAAKSDEELRVLLKSVNVIARARPDTKARLVRLLQEEGEVVAMTGDGTNDAPALKQADVGIAMGVRGTDVAKSVSDIVLTDDNFGSIVRAVKWGRTLYENLQKFLQFQLTVNISALFFAFISPLAALFWPNAGFSQTPLTVLQFLWLNLIMDTLAALAFGLEPPRPEVMSMPPKETAEPFVTRAMAVNIVAMGVVFVAVMLVVQTTDWLGAPDAQKATAVFNCFVWLQLFNAVNARSVNARESAFGGLFRSRSFLGVMGLVVAIQVLMVQYGGQLFQTVPLAPSVWLRTLSIGVFVLLAGGIVHAGIRWIAVAKKGTDKYGGRK
ncbi:MAG: calcium-translocating P-type ATPase, PMCA-type [Kiritimatiellae bacterium]|nr:calcium-translocating P-type ATPase, PMCA-type [Kiritimatiellia bacterium]